MKTIGPFRTAVAPAARDGRTSPCSAFLITAALLLPFTAIAQSATAVKAVTIVLPPKVVAGRPATLAVLGADGRLAPNVAVDMGANLRVTTDRTGRALFVVPASGSALIAKASGATAVALIDAPRLTTAPASAASVTPVAGLHDPFAFCAAGLSGDADANLVKINGEFALVLAASPECLVALAPPKAAARPGESLGRSVANPGDAHDLNIRLANARLAGICAANSSAAAREKESLRRERARIGSAASPRR